MKKTYTIFAAALVLSAALLTFSCANDGRPSDGTSEKGTSGSTKEKVTETTVDEEPKRPDYEWIDYNADYSDGFLFSTADQEASADLDGSGSPAILIRGEGSFFKFGFKGNGIRINIANCAEKYCNRVRVYIDGMQVELLNLVKENAVETFSVKKGLEDREHTIMIINDAPSQNGSWDTWIYGVSVKTKSYDPVVKLSADTNNDLYYAPIPEPKQDTIYKETDSRTFRLRAASTEVTVRADGNTVYICSVLNPVNGYEWLAAERKIDLPASTQRFSNGKTSDESALDWVLTSVGENTAEDGTYSLRFRFENAEPRMVLDDIWTVTVSDGPVQHTMKVYNKTTFDYLIGSQQSFDADIRSDSDLTAWRFHKENFVADSRGTYSDVLTDGKSVTAKSTTIVDTSNASGFVPAIYFDDNGLQGFYVCWEWPDGRVTAKRDGGTVRVMAGVDDQFRTKIEKNSSFLVPTAYIGTYVGDIDDGTNVMKGWFLKEKAPSKLLEDENEPQTQVGCYLYPAEHNFKEMGIRSVKFDYGWWETEENEGYWVPNKRDVIARIKKNGCKDLADYGRWLKDQGVSLTLYLLLHDAKMDAYDVASSIGRNGHPEWFTDVKASKSESADLGNVNCVSFYKNKIYRTITGYNITTWRTDMEPIAFSSIYDNRHVFSTTDTTYWNATGFYEILDYLYETIPGFRYENCGSGGAYKDFATMSRSLVVQMEDRASVSNNRRTFYTSSYMYSPLMLGSVVSPDMFNPNVTESYTGYDFDFGLRSCIMSVPMICVWKGAKDGHYLHGLEEKVSEYFNMYINKIVPIQKGGNTYHILPRPDDIHWDGMEFYNPASGDGVTFLFKPTDTEGSVKRIYFDGLENDASYVLTFQDNKSANCTMTGRELTEEGIEVTIKGSFGSELIWFSKK